MGWGLHSHYVVKPNLVLGLGWGFDNLVDKQDASSNTGVGLKLSLVDMLVFREKKVLEKF